MKPVRLRHLILVVVCLGLAAAGAVTLQLARPVSSRPDRWSDHSGPILDLQGRGQGFMDLQAFMTGQRSGDEEAWDIVMPGFSERRLHLPKPLDLRPFTGLKFPLRLEGDRMGRVLVALRLVHHNGWIYETWRECGIERGAETPFLVDLRPSSAEFAPIGHGRPWDGESARAIGEIQLKVRSPRAFQGRLHVGVPTILGYQDQASRSTPSARQAQPTPAEAAGAWPPANLEVLDLAAHRLGELVEVSFRLEPMPPDPFDHEVCDPRVLLLPAGPDTPPPQPTPPTPPALTRPDRSGQALGALAFQRARPAFFDQEYLYQPSAPNPAEALRPVAAPLFKARIRLPPQLLRQPRGDPAAEAGEGTAKPAPLPPAGLVVFLFLNGRPLGQAPLAPTLPQAPGGPAADSASSGPLPAGELRHPPSWTFEGGEAFCQTYRPRSAWTGMPWTGECARYLGRGGETPGVEPPPGQPPLPQAAREPAGAAGAGPAWTYEEWPEQTLCWTPPLEWNEAWGKWQGLGRYDLELCWRFDRILERAGREGVRLPLLLTSDELFFNQGKFRWPMNPLAAEAGGPVAGPGSFFRDPAARSFLLRRLRYLAARYGASPALGGWLLGAALPADEAPRWHARVAAQAEAWEEARGWARSALELGGEALPAEGARRPIVSLHPWSTAFRNETRKNSFEPDSSDHLWWKAEQRLSPGTRREISTERASEGKRSVALEGRLPGQVCLMRELLFEKNEADNFYAYDCLLFDCFVPQGAPHDMRAVVHLRDRDELWYEALLDPLLRPGDWTRLVVDVSGRNLHGLKPVGHARPWDDYSRTRIREIGIRIFCAHPFAGKLHLDNIHFAGKQEGRREPLLVPRIVPRAAPPPEVERFAKWELDFDLNKSYPNPYDPEVVEVFARISTPSGLTREVPCFFYEPYERRLVTKTVDVEARWQKQEVETPVEEIVPVRGGLAGFWKLRYTPEESGEHQVVVLVREGGRWKTAREEWVPDNRFTPEGKPLPGNRYHGQFTEIRNRRPDGQRRMEWIEFLPGPLAAQSETLRFKAGGGANPGFIRVSKDPRYLEYSNGRFYYPLGMNLATPSEQQIPFRDGDWDYLRLAKIGFRGTYQYDDYFAAFEKHGLNWAKLWMATWWTGLEWRRDWPPYQGVGRYSQPNAWKMDHLLEEAARRGIYLQVILMNHGQISSGINHDWENSPYNAELGGPLNSAREFFSQAEAKKFYKNKLRYIAARWGYATSVFDWSLCGEMDFTEEYQTNSFDLWVPSNDRPAPETMKQWLEEMGAYMKRVDPGRHLISTHLSHPQRGQNLQAASALDVVQSNAYSGFPWLADGGMNAVRAIEAYYYGQGGTHHFNGMRQFNKPVVICEQGGHWHGISWKYGEHTRNTRESLDADLHCGLWAGILSPMAGQTGYWWWLHVHFDALYEHFHGAAAFLRGEDLRGADFERSSPILKGGEGLEALAFHNPKRGFVWLYDKTLPNRLSQREFEEVELGVGVGPGQYEVEFWHTLKGEILKRVTLPAIPNPNPREGPRTILWITTPAFSGDLAIKFRRKET